MGVEPYRTGFRVRWTGPDGVQRARYFTADDYSSAERFWHETQEAKQDRRSRRRLARLGAMASPGGPSSTASAQGAGSASSAPFPRALPYTTFAEAAALWLSTNGKHKKSLNKDRINLSLYVLPHFEGFALVDITSLEIRKFSAKLAETPRHLPRARRAEVLERRTRQAPPLLAKATQRAILATLSAILRQAALDGVLAAPPIIKRPKMPLQPKNYRYLRTAEEITRFLDSAAIESRLVHVLYATMIYTGLRVGEVAGLTWTDVDLANRRIVVRSSFQRGETKGMEVEPVPVIDKLLPLLTEWKDECPGTSEGLVFPSRHGGMLSPNHRLFRSTFHKVLHRAGFPKGYITPHGTRHTFASHLVKNGANPRMVQKILRHKSFSVTERYVHLQDEAFRSEYSRL